MTATYGNQVTSFSDGGLTVNSPLNGLRQADHRFLKQTIIDKQMTLAGCRV